MRKIKSELKVFNQADEPTSPGVIPGLKIKKLAGCKKRPAERISVGLATFGPGTHEHLHWHPIEVFYYVLKGSAVVHDLAGKAYKVGPGDSIYAPAGIAGSHEWHIGKDGLELLSIRATIDGHRRMQFTVNRNTGESVIDMHELGRMDAISFESHY